MQETQGFGGFNHQSGTEQVLDDGSVLVMGGDRDRPVFSSKGPNFNDVWRTTDGGRTWALVTTAPWSPRTGHKCVQLSGKIYCVGGAHQNGTTYLQHDVWASADGKDWSRVSVDAWGCDAAAPSCGKDDELLLVRDGALWTFGGDEETGSGGKQVRRVLAGSHRVDHGKGLLRWWP